MLYEIQFPVKQKNPLPAGAGQQTALELDAANLRRCFEWKLSDGTERAGLLARRSAPFRPSHGSPAMAYSDQLPAHSDLISSGFYLIPSFILRILPDQSKDIAICFDPARNIHLSCSFFNKRQTSILPPQLATLFLPIPSHFLFCLTICQSDGFRNPSLQVCWQGLACAILQDRQCLRKRSLLMICHNRMLLRNLNPPDSQRRRQEHQICHRKLRQIAPPKCSIFPYHI